MWRVGARLRRHMALTSVAPARVGARRLLTHAHFFTSTPLPTPHAQIMFVAMLLTLIRAFVPLRISNVCAYARAVASEQGFDTTTFGGGKCHFGEDWGRAFRKVTTSVAVCARGVEGRCLARTLLEVLCHSIRIVCTLSHLISSSDTLPSLFIPLFSATP